MSQLTAFNTGSPEPSCIAHQVALNWGTDQLPPEHSRLDYPAPSTLRIFYNDGSSLTVALAENNELVLAWAEDEGGAQ